MNEEINEGPKCENIKRTLDNITIKESFSVKSNINNMNKYR